MNISVERRFVKMLRDLDNRMLKSVRQVGVNWSLSRMIAPLYIFHWAELG